LKLQRNNSRQYWFKIVNTDPQLTPDDPQHWNTTTTHRQLYGRSTNLYGLHASISALGCSNHLNRSVTP